LKPHILLIEDNAGRIDIFTRWLNDTEFLLATARSAGQAMGMLSKGSTAAIAGVLLDHDLSDSPLTETDLTLSATQVVPLLKQKIKRAVPVLVHSHHHSKSRFLQRSLEADGFSATRIRFEALTEARFRLWLDDVRDNWDPEDV
jgi:CheY-like chemotaxis protein